MIRKTEVLFVVSMVMMPFTAEAALRFKMEAKTISQKASKRAEMTSTITMDKGNVRVDLSWPEISTIVRENGDSITLLRAGRRYTQSKIDRNAGKESAQYRSSLTYKKISSGVMVSGLSCDDFDVFDKKQKKVMQLCLADLKSNGLANEVPSAAKVTLMQTVFKDSLSEIPVGLPARLISFSEGKPTAVIEISKLERLSSVSPATFQVPKNYSSLQLFTSPQIKLPKLESLIKF